MYVWIVLWSLLLPARTDRDDTEVVATSPLRYRGIERLLAKFDAEEPPARPSAPK